MTAVDDMKIISAIHTIGLIIPRKQLSRGTGIISKSLFHKSFRCKTKHDAAYFTETCLKKQHGGNNCSSNLNTLTSI